MPATIKQVAALAGVSAATVSKYLNGVKLNDKNKNAVESAIDTLNYKSNVMARGLRTNKSMTIGAVVYDFNNMFAMGIISEIENYVSGYGYGVIICESKFNNDIQKEKLKFLLDKHVDGLIIFPVNLTDGDIKGITVPIVCIDRLTQTRNCDYILTENSAASFQATEHLIENGHTKIGIINGFDDIYTARERLSGYLSAHEKYRLDIRDEFIFKTNFSIKSGYSAVLQMLENTNRPTALFATNYETTLGAVIALNEHGINIPDDISFIGFDNLELANAVKPKLSVVLQPTAQIGIKAAEVLLNKIAEKSGGFDTVKIPMQFITQKSVKKIN